MEFLAGGSKFAQKILHAPTIFHVATFVRV